MQCEEIEVLLADALGGELAEDDRQVLEAHLAACERCRSEYESSRSAIEDMRQLPGPPNIDVRREGDRLVIVPATGAPSRPVRRFMPVMLRYAASILIAFLAGYVFRAAMATEGRQPELVHSSDDQKPRTVEPPRPSVMVALAGEHARRRGRSELASCMKVLFGQ